MKHKEHLALAIITWLICFTPIQLQAQKIVKWVDEQGRTHYGEKLPPGEKSEKIETRVSEYTPVKNDSQIFEQIAKEKKKNVVMYSTRWCGYCKKARNFLKKHAIPFIEYDIERSAKAKAQHQALGGGGVPLFVVGKQTIRGFNPTEIAASYRRLK